MVIEETVAFVENLLYKVNGEKKIVIVDNNSSNGSGKELQRMYLDNPDITIILNNENLGFAKGNNIGYRYAKEHFQPKFIAIANNDIELPQPEFIQLVEDIYKKEKFAVLGPEIFSTNEKIYQSPKKLSHYTYDQVLAERDKYAKRNASQFIVPLKSTLKKNKLVKSLNSKRKKITSQIDPTKKYVNPIIHGSFLIVSELFIEKRDNAFFEGTYMYFETEILDYQCQRDGLKVIYDPSVKVLHHHSTSTASSFSSELKKVRFMNRCILDSLNAFLVEMEKEK
ncbi:glycosyltransferase [Streptococcus loxodontisalivarius]|uniref:GT2 family glycosyltransferase n=1 Tax=Streptococcus loxodontisalivarius TaxID=1349415 RepID=A0ABS2PP21_9STRE|nr:GT2 family glycosyltransferase [Streptococcus loxodontisalivarius]